MLDDVTLWSYNFPLTITETSVVLMASVHPQELRTVLVGYGVGGSVFHAPLIIPNVGPLRSGGIHRYAFTMTWSGHLTKLTATWRLSVSPIDIT